MCTSRCQQLAMVTKINFKFENLGEMFLLAPFLSFVRPLFPLLPPPPPNPLLPPSLSSVPRLLPIPSLFLYSQLFPLLPLPPILTVILTRSSAINKMYPCKWFHFDGSFANSSRFLCSSWHLGGKYLCAIKCNSKILQNPSKSLKCHSNSLWYKNRQEYPGVFYKSRYIFVPDTSFLLFLYDYSFGTLNLIM